MNMKENVVIGRLLDQIASDVFLSTSSSDTTVYFGQDYRIKIDADYDLSFSGCCMYTEGLESYKHENFEVVFPMPIKSAVTILKGLADNVVGGAIYGSGYVYSTNDTVLFKTIYIPNNRLRVIISDLDNAPDRRYLYAMQSCLSRKIKQVG